jgi:antitoxin protein of toxin-antitoxin system
MGFGDKLKDLRKQAQEAVSEHSEQLHNVLDVAGAAANEKTRGKHTQRIAKFGEKASEKLDKFAASDGSEEGAAAEAAAPEAAAPAGDTSAAAAEQPAASAEPESSVPPPPPAPPSPPPAAPAANPDLAAWAAGDDSASQ